MPKGVRSSDQRTITVSIPRSLVAQIDQFAEGEKRSRSNWIVKELEELMRQRSAEKITILPRAAEGPGRYPNNNKKSK